MKLAEQKTTVKKEYTELDNIQAELLNLKKLLYLLLNNVQLNEALKIEIDETEKAQLLKFSDEGINARLVLPKSILNKKGAK